MDWRDLAILLRKTSIKSVVDRFRLLYSGYGSRYSPTAHLYGHVLAVESLDEQRRADRNRRVGLSCGEDLPVVR